MHFVTVISPVRRHKKLFSYYLIIWRKSTLSLKDDPDNKDDPNNKDDSSTRFYEIPRDSTLSSQDDSNNKDNPNDKDDPNNRTTLIKIPS
jgi:hypothetical protein